MTEEQKPKKRKRPVPIQAKKTNKVELTYGEAGILAVLVLIAFVITGGMGVLLGYNLAPRDQLFGNQKGTIPAVTFEINIPTPNFTPASTPVPPTIPTLLPLPTIQPFNPPGQNNNQEPTATAEPESSLPELPDNLPDWYTPPPDIPEDASVHVSESGVVSILRNNGTPMVADCEQFDGRAFESLNDFEQSDFLLWECGTPATPEPESSLPDWYTPPPDMPEDASIHVSESGVVSIRPNGGTPQLADCTSFFDVPFEALNEDEQADYILWRCDEQNRLPGWFRIPLGLPNQVSFTVLEDGSVLVEYALSGEQKQDRYYEPTDDELPTCDYLSDFKSDFMPRHHRYLYERLNCGGEQ